VEPDSRSHAVAASRIEPLGGTVLLGDDTAVDSASEFDLVCAFEVLEHIKDDEEALVAWRGFIKPGGHLLLSVPAWQHRFGPTDRQVGHYRRYDPDALTAMLGRAGFRDVRATLYGWPLGYALEMVRNAVARRQLRDSAPAESMADRTAASGRFRQPKDDSMVGLMVAAAIRPFTLAQRMQPARGVGLVAVATRP
jgi:SAM-dependent methyltransferase